MILRDEILLTREEVERKHKSRDAFCDIVKDIQLKLGLDHLKVITRK